MMNTYTGTQNTKFETQSALTPENGFFSREQRLSDFGVDCSDDITWRIWNVGGEYERKFVIKNVHDKRQIISYKLPKQKATFFVEFPEPATISSGMSYSLLVRFRPIELVEHHDELEINVKGRGSFKIRLDAYTPYAHLTTPSKFDFNMCPVNVSSRHVFQIKNTGTVPLSFYWEIPQPFSLEPSHGSLIEGQSMDVTVAFTPTSACAGVAQAICRLDETNDIIAVTNFSGIGKFAFIRLKDCNEGTVDFGNVLTSTSEVKYLSLVNPSFVDTDFDLGLTNPDITNAFIITPMSGTVPRGGETRLTIKFNPKNSGAHYTSDFSVNSVSCATISKFRLTGSAVGPKVHLSASNVDFGDVDIESFYRDPSNPSAATVLSNTKVTTPSTVDKWVTVHNDSDIPIKFHFAGCDPGCAFRVTPVAGMLKAKSSTNVKITFAPTSPINHLRRIFVMTSGGEHALILDVFGSAFTSKIRPAPFNAKAVQLFFSKLEYGLGAMTPEEAERLISAINSGEEVSASQAGAQDAFRAALEEIKYPKKRRGGFATVFPKSAGKYSFPFTIDRTQLTIRHETVGQVQTVVVRNTTTSKATANWATPAGDNGKFWSVEPQSQDVPSMGSAIFRITCAPNAPAQTFGSYLECYVNYKTMRSFRLVNEDVFTPPHCLLVQCTHLAPHRENGPVPAVTFPAAISFQPCREQRSVYQVLELTNNGDTSIAFDLQIESSMVPDAHNKEYFSTGSADVDEQGNPIVPDPEDDLIVNKRKALLSEVFQCYPSAGTLPAKSSFMVLAKFTPARVSKFYGALHISYNGAPSISGNVLLKGEGFVPQIELDSNSVLAFRPTTVGGSTTRQYTVTNMSRIPLTFRAHIPEEFQDTVQLTPDVATLKGCEKLKITATFSPQEARVYEFKFPVTVSVPTETDIPLSGTMMNVTGTTNAPSMGTKNAADINASPEIPALDDGAPYFNSSKAPPEAAATQMCTCKAEGHAAFLSLEPLSTNLGDIGVGAPTNFPLTIYNTGLSDVGFVLRYKLLSCEDDPTAVGKIEKGLLSFGPAPNGSIRARSHHTVSVCTKLSVRGKHSMVVYVISGGDLSLLEQQEDPSEEQLAALPQCIVTANGQHSTLQIADARCVYQQKSQLWRQMSIGKINDALLQPVDAKDRQMRALSFDDSLAALAPIACNLGVDVFHAAPIRVHIALANNGSSRVDFRFRFPIDNEIPKEPWHADQRGLDDPIANVVDRGLFDISPRSGCVEAGDQTIITFTYFHSDVGTHQLPVILRVEEGRQVLLQLSATTIEPGKKHLLFHHDSRHELVPVAIGDLEPPIQYTEVQNLSATSANYSIDESTLTSLKDANYDFPILQCLNPRGVIPPMSSLLLSWFFRPLEAKAYEAAINVSVEGGDSYNFTIAGKGYHPKHISKNEICSIYETMFPMPRVPTLVHPSLPLRLSTDVLCFGPVPFHSFHRRHVALTNSHDEDTFIFEWRSVLQHGDQIFEVEPPRGVIEPGVTVHFCITLYTGSFSHIIDTPVHCHVMNESLRLRRQERIAAREEERRLAMDQKPETAELASNASGTIRSARSAIDTLTGRGLKPRHRHAITTVPPKFQSTARLQKTIQKLEETALAEDVDENAEEWAHIEVTPTVIELLVQTRIMPLGHFTEAYGEEAAQSLFFPTMLGNMHPTKPGYLLGGAPNRPESVISDSSLSQILQSQGNNKPAFLADVTPHERDIADSCITEILRRVVQLPGILDTFNDPTEDPVPYFCEMIATHANGDERRGPSAIAELVIDEDNLPEEAFEDGEPNGLARDAKDAAQPNQLSDDESLPEQREGTPIPTNPDGSASISPTTGIVPAFPRIKKSTQPIPGDVQCVAEEVLSDVLFYLVSQALERDGVVTQATEGAKRQRRASEARMLKPYE